MENEKETTNKHLLDIQVSYFESCTNPRPSKTTTIGEIVDAIKNGEVKNLIDDIRQTEDKEARTAKKKLLPAVTASGTFSPTRNKANVVKHSGLLQGDLDDLQDPASVLELLKNDPYTFISFISPSGTGVKLFILIPAEAETHYQRAKAAEEYYLTRYGLQLDPSCSDVTRLCYLSYHPGIYVHTGALMFDKLSHRKALGAPKGNDLLSKVKLAVERIMEAQKDITSGHMEETRIAYALAGALGETGRGYYHDVCRLNPSYDKDECDKRFTNCLKGSYHGTGIQAFFNIAKNHGIDLGAHRLESSTPSTTELPEVVEGFPIKTLYEVKKDEDGMIRTLNILQANFYKLLRAMGYSRYDIEKTYVYVRVRDNVIQEVGVTHMQDEVLRILTNLPEKLSDGVPREFLQEKFVRSIDALFSDRKLTVVGTGTFSLCEDTSAKAHLFYRNGFVVCTADGYSLHSYSELKGCVWRTMVLERDFQKVVESQSEHSSVFEKFTRNVAGDEAGRFDSLRSIIGYLLHRRFEGKRRAVILTDSEVTDVSNGRTGKSLFAKALAQVTAVCEVNGKDHDPDRPFKWQEVNLDTQVVHLNDVRKNFALEKSFNAITESLSVEKKGKQPFRKDVKMLISTNRTIKIEGASARDRVVEFEFVNHYHEAFSPRDEFGKWFFGEGWTQQDWIEFDNFICGCLCFYLSKGLVKPAQINLNKRKLFDSTPDDFVNFLEERINNGKIKADELLCKNVLKVDFTNEYPEYIKRLDNVRSITQWLRNYANLSGRFAPNNPRQDETTRGGQRYFVFRSQDYKRTDCKEFVPPVKDSPSITDAEVVVTEISDLMP